MYQTKYHIGIIPDGNRRWAKNNGLNTKTGHQNGSEKMELFVNWAVKNPDIDEITIYGLSEENFNRNQSELSN